MSIARTLLIGFAAGAAATAAKSKAEELLQPQAEKLLPPAPGEKAEIGADPAGHPENMPPGELADRVQHAITGDQLADAQRETASDVLHWGMGLGFAGAYALASTAVPAVRAGHGTAAGVGLFAAAHVIGLPAAGVQHSPAQLPKAWWIWEGGSHLVYGAVLDTALRVLDRVTPG